jgi:hypothetical protein
MSKIEVNEIDKQNGSTLTLGGSGTAVTLASGATQSGFGRSGSVDWQTSIKTTGFTAVSGEGYFCNTTGGAFTVTLPASPSAGDIVSISDYAQTFDTNNLTIGRNGSNIAGSALDSTISTEGIAVTLVYADATKGWIVTESGLQSDAPGPTFITATGGTITTCGDDKIHTFTGPGTFTVCSVSNCASNNIVSHVVVAGGGGGGGFGGGGAGGFREVKNPVTPYTASPLDGYSCAPNRVTVTATAFPITVGSGGAGNSSPRDKGVKGSNSVFSTVTSAGGGFGGAFGPSGEKDGGPGGSGGGAGTICTPTYPPGTVGSGNTPPVSPPQGQNGGTGAPSGGAYGGAGGGAGAVGTSAPGSGAGAKGGTGVASSITGSSVTRAGGGGGAGGSPTDNAALPGGGTGGTGGGGAGAPGPAPTTAADGTANTGGGGGGNYVCATAGSGGSGIVIIRYKFQ